MTNLLNEKATYLYTDEAGNTLFTKERYIKKDGSKGYAYSHLNSEGVRVNTMPQFATSTPLYNLHGLAKYPNETIYLVEGEKCVEALTKLKLLATTSGGAQSDDKTDWQPLTGRKVIAWADNDDAGLGYIQRATQKLLAFGATVKHIDIDALNLPPKGDVVDWLQWFEAENGRPATKANIESLPLKTDLIQSPTSDHLTASDAKVLPEADDDVIARLVALKPLDYDRVRLAEAKALKVQVKTLDSMVKAGRSDESEADRLPFTEVEPHPEPIDPAQLLDEVADTIRRFIVLDDPQADAVALWVVLTHFIDVVEIAPLLIVNAPEKSCGKTQLLTVIGRMTYRPLPASNASASALFRAVEAWKPTILIDEADTFFRDNAELHGMVNAGYLRDGFVLRSEAVGDSFEPRMFSVFSAKALAGIALERHLTDATMSRGVAINLRRKLPHESVSRLRHADRDLFSNIAKKLARFALDYSQPVRLARPALPDELSDRDQDNWEGLLAIASYAGDEWVKRATKAALKLSGASEKVVSTGNELLSNIQHIFKNKRVDKINFADLIQALCDDDEAGWATYNRGNPITPRQVSKRLREYGISSKSTRFGCDKVQKSFDSDQFNDAFARYLKSPDFPVTQLHSSNGADFDVTNGKDVTVAQSNPVTLKPSNGEGCNHVTGKTPILGEAEASRPNTSHLRI